MILAIKYFIQLFVMVNPFVGGLPVSIGLLEGKSISTKTKFMAREILLAGSLLFIFMIAGPSLLDAIGIPMYTVQIGGGFILIRTGFALLDENKVSTSTNRISIAQLPVFVPIALPLIAGPGSISVVLNMSAAYDSIIVPVLILLAVLFTVSLVYAVGLIASHAIPHYVLTGISKIAGLLVTFLGVGLIISGISTAFPVVAVC